MNHLRTTLSAIVAIALVACCLLALSACSGKTTAAKFGDNTIYENEVTEYTQEFRASNGLEDDADWASYLTQNAYTGKTWREKAIRTLADKILIQDKASELGLSVDENAVAERIAEAKEAAGIAASDEAAWKEYLASTGKTPESFLEECRYNNLQQQVYEHELDFTTELHDEMCDDYIKSYLGDQVVRRYSCITFSLDNKENAANCLAELEKLSGDKLLESFDAKVQEMSESATDAFFSGDLGWDFLYSDTIIDPDNKLRAAKVPAGELYPQLLKGTDAYRVVLCAERVELAGAKYASLSSESLKDVISNLTKSSIWAAQCMKYMSELEESAHIEVAEMPSGLPYDVVEDTSTSTDAS